MFDVKYSALVSLASNTWLHTGQSRSCMQQRFPYICAICVPVLINVFCVDLQLSFPLLIFTRTLLCPMPTANNWPKPLLHATTIPKCAMCVVRARLDKWTKAADIIRDKLTNTPRRQMHCHSRIPFDKDLDNCSRSQLTKYPSCWCTGWFDQCCKPQLRWT